MERSSINSSKLLSEKGVKKLDLKSLKPMENHQVQINLHNENNVQINLNNLENAKNDKEVYFIMIDCRFFLKN
jgi:hypothetical protein